MSEPDRPASDAGYFPYWRLRLTGEIMPDQRLPWTLTALLGMQHVVAMFGTTALAPLLMGFDPNVSIFFSGVATLIFFVVVGGRVPSYLGSSFAFIGPVLAVTGAHVGEPNPKLAVALGGIVVAGAVYAMLGLLVMRIGARWLERLLPPVLTGAIVAAIGLVLAPVAINSASGISATHAEGTGFARAIALLTVTVVGLIAVYGRGTWRRLAILLGGAVGYLAYWLGANGVGWATPLDFDMIGTAAWFGLPHFVQPSFHAPAIGAIVPVVLILAAENLGHIKAIGAMTSRNFDSLLGRAFLGDGVSTLLAGLCGGTGVTTYAENMGVMAVTRIFSSLVFVAAALMAILLGFSPKFGAVIGSIPGPVLGGESLVVFGMIVATAGRIWVEHRVDFAQPANLFTVGLALVLAAGNFKLHLGPFTLDGIGTACFGAIIFYHLLHGRDR